MKIAACIALCLFFACLANAQGSNNNSSDQISQYRDMPEFNRSLIYQKTDHIVRVHSLQLDNVTNNPFIFSAYDGSDSPNNTGCFEVVLSSLMMNKDTQQLESVRHRIELRKVFEFNDTNGDGLYKDGEDMDLSSIFTWSSETANKRSLVCDNATSSDQVSEDQLSSGNFSSGSVSNDNLGTSRKEFVNCTLTVSNENITIALTMLIPSKIVEGKIDPQIGELSISADQLQSSGNSSNSGSSNSSSIGDSVFLLPTSTKMHLRMDFPKRTQGSMIGCVFVLKSIDKVEIADYSPDNYTMLSSKAAIFDKGAFFAWNETAYFGQEKIQVVADKNLVEEGQDDPSKNVDKGRIENELSNHLTFVFKTDKLQQQSSESNSLLWHDVLGMDVERLLANK